MSANCANLQMQQIQELYAPLQHLILLEYIKFKQFAQRNRKLSYWSIEQQLPGGVALLHPTEGTDLAPHLVKT